MRQTSLFDTPRPLAPTGKQLKQEGMQRAAESKHSQVAHARGLALAVARGELPHADGELRADGLVSMDDVMTAWEADNADRRANGDAEVPQELGNAAGSVFSGLRHMWAPTGQWIKSARPVAHSNRLQIWKLIQ